MDVYPLHTPKYPLERIDMMENEPKYTLYLDREVIDQVSYEEKDLLCVLAILLECCKNSVVYGDCEIACTPSTLWANITRKIKTTATDRRNFVSSINRLSENGTITLLDHETKTIKWSTLLKIDASNILHNSNCPFVCISSDELDGIKYKEYKHATLAIILQLYVSIVSYFDMSQIEAFDNAIANGENPLDESYDLYGELNYHISCWASYERLMTTKHSSDIPSDTWLQRQLLSDSLKLLEELGLIAIVRPQVKGSKEHFTNHYCFPRHKKYVQQIANMQAKQIVYKRQEKLTE